MGRSTLFKDALKAERSRRLNECAHQKNRRGRAKIGRVQVKLGHGGTLDPMATGVLVIGLYAGTKKLPSLLNGVKEYEATAILGAATDTYDRLGKVTTRAEWKHVTREMVEEQLASFRGDIMQVPPLYSALNMNGKRLYEYARSGEELPMEIKARPMKVDKLELVSFETEHDWILPHEEAEPQLKELAEKFDKKVEQAEKLTGSKAKKAKLDGASGARDSNTPTPTTTSPRSTSPSQSSKPPIMKFRLTVSSGFYVRSFIHDLGIALGSASHMIALVRTRQSDFALGRENTLEWEDFGIKLRNREPGNIYERGAEGAKIENTTDEVEEKEVEEKEEEEDVQEESGPEEDGVPKEPKLWETNLAKAIELYEKNGENERVRS